MYLVFKNSNRSIHSELFKYLHTLLLMCSYIHPSNHIRTHRVCLHTWILPLRIRQHWRCTRQNLESITAEQELFNILLVHKWTQWDKHILIHCHTNRFFFSGWGPIHTLLLLTEQLSFATFAKFFGRTIFISSFVAYNSKGLWVTS